ncbi:DNA repair protein RecO [Methylomonas sp. AM2-LC]|uniref:DNA repair protein RecO n=1 Tax=Methylomonas sp. AM2-LC TaxID=3153301 RepID=UPI0032658A6B
MEAVVYLQPALILQHHAYRESSLLLEVFTRDYGIISVLAKGVRKEKSKMAGLLLPFILVNISYLGRNELKTLTQVEFVSSYPLQGMSLYCGFYVNELLQKFLHKYDPYPALFVRYLHCLQALSSAETIEQTLRYFELDLLQDTGYGIQLDVDCETGVNVDSVQRYHYLPAHGMKYSAHGIISGETLQLLAKNAMLDTKALSESKILLRKMLDSYLQGKPLKSRDVLANIIQYL